MRLVTSIPPRFSRKDPFTGKEIGERYLKECIASWRGNGFEPVSLNRPDEVAAVEAMDLIEVRAVPVHEAREPKRFGPCLGAIFDAFPADEPIALVNADIYMLRAEGGFAPIAETQAELGLLACRRTDVGYLGASFGDTYAFGYDLFVFTPGRIPRTIADAGVRSFQLGAPWWDYIFPIACSYEVPTFRVEEPLLAHQLHEERWDRRSRDLLAREACKTLARIDADSFSRFLQEGIPAARLGQELAAVCQARLFGASFQPLPVPLSDVDPRFLVEPRTTLPPAWATTTPGAPPIGRAMRAIARDTGTLIRNSGGILSRSIRGHLARKAARREG